MPRETWTFEELFEGLDPAPSFVQELQRLGLLRVVARDGGGKPLYASEAREQLDKVLSLVELGYQPRDIAAIARRVGLPEQGRRRRFRRPPTYIRQAELARRSGIDEVRIGEWSDLGLLRASMETDGGEPLYATAAIEAARAILALLSFGFAADVVARWSGVAGDLRAIVDEAGDGGEDLAGTEPAQVAATQELLVLAQDAVRTIRRRLDVLRAGIRRWDKILAAYDKRLDRARRDLGMEPAPRETDRRKRRLRRGRRKPAD